MVGPRGATDRWVRDRSTRRLCHARLVEIDLLFDPFGVRVDDALAGATAAERAGFGGVWAYDHLAGSVHGRDRVLECWTTLTAMAAEMTPSPRSSRANRDNDMTDSFTSWRTA
jgi:hypothetical protein